MLTSFLLPQTIPFRMLETFTSESQVSRFIDDPATVRSFLEDVYTYLVKRKYFKLVRQMIDEKVPPLDGPVLVAPNAISETLLQMIVHPLKLINSCTGCSQQILGSFIEQIIAPEFSDPIKSFVLPCLANDPQFPFLHFIQYLGKTIYNNNNDESSGNSQMETDQMSATSHSTAPAITNTSCTVANDLYTSPFLLYALLCLDRLHLDRLAEIEYLAAYIRIIASMSANLNRLPRRSNRPGAVMLKSEDSSDSDSDDERTGYVLVTENCSQMEQECLLDIVARLNDMTRARLIVENIELHFLDDPEVLHCLCKICHHLMLYNRSAIIEYKCVISTYSGISCKIFYL